MFKKREENVNSHPIWQNLQGIYVNILIQVMVTGNDQGQGPPNNLLQGSKILIILEVTTSSPDFLRIHFCTEPQESLFKKTSKCQSQDPLL